MGTEELGLGDNISFVVRRIVIPALNWVMVHPLFKKSTLEPGDLNSYHPVSSIPFSSKVTERMVVGHLQGQLDETNCLDSFQFGFRSGYMTETVLVALVDD